MVLDGYRYHRSRYAWDRDRRRKREARARGDELLRYTHADVFEHPAPMLAELRARVPPCRPGLEGCGGTVGRTPADFATLSPMAGFLQRAVLRAPDSVARAASARAPRPEERWILRQPRRVRESYARTVLAAPDTDRAQEIWMLRQPDEVRESYVREVLGG